MADAEVPADGIDSVEPLIGDFDSSARVDLIGVEVVFNSGFGIRIFAKLFECDWEEFDRLAFFRYFVVRACVASVVSSCVLVLRSIVPSSLVRVRFTASFLGFRFNSFQDFVFSSSEVLDSHTEHESREQVESENDR